MFRLSANANLICVTLNLVGGSVCVEFELDWEAGLC